MTRCNMRFVTLLLVFSLLLVSISTPGLARVKPLYTYYNMYYGARSLGLGNAFTGMSDDLTAVFVNPAGVAEFQSPRVFFSYRSNRLDFSLPSQTMEMDGSVEQYDYSMESTLKNADFIAIAAPVVFWDVRWNFALSYYRFVPYGFNGQSVGITSLDGNFASAGTTALDITGSSGIDVMAFTGAFYLADYLSFGITVQRFFNSGDMSFRETTNANSSILTTTNVDKIDDMNVILGLKVKFNQQIALGITYHSKHSGTLKSSRTVTIQDDTGTQVIDSSSEANVTVPARISAGLYLKPYDWLDLTADYSKRYWSRGTVTNYFGLTDELPYPVLDAFTFNQKDVENLRFGGQIKVPLKHVSVAMRGGYSIDQQLYPDALDGKFKLKGFSFGLGVEFAPWLELDIAYMKQTGTLKETGWYDPSTTVDGKLVNKVFCLSATFSFAKKPRVKH